MPSGVARKISIGGGAGGGLTKFMGEGLTKNVANNCIFFLHAPDFQWGRLGGRGILVGGGRAPPSPPIATPLQPVEPK